MSDFDAEAAFEEAMGLDGQEDRLPLVLIERGLLQTWNLGLPYAVLPGEHLGSAAMRGEVPRMPPVCGVEHFRPDTDVTLVCMLEPGHENRGASPNRWGVYVPHGWTKDRDAVLAF